MALVPEWKRVASDHASLSDRAAVGVGGRKEKDETGGAEVGLLAVGAPHVGLVVGEPGVCLDQDRAVGVRDAAVAGT